MTDCPFPAATMAETLDLAHQTRLRQKIHKYLAQQRPRMPTWDEMRQRLTDDGDIARNFIFDKGADIFIEVRDELRTAQIGLDTPPSSPEDQLAHKTRSRDDGVTSRPPPDAGPRMVNPDGLYDIRVVPNERNNVFTSLSANICEGSQSFISRDTIKRSGKNWSIDPQTNTVILSWRGYPQWNRIFGESRVHCIACKVVPSEQMCHVDVAIAEDKGTWNALPVSSSGAASGIVLPSGVDSSDDDQVDCDLVARMIVAAAREVKKPKRRREEDQSDAGASRARRERWT